MLIRRALRVAQNQQPAERMNFTTNETTNLRDYLHVLDVAEAHALALESPEQGDARVYNPGNERGFPNEEVLEMCHKVLAGQAVEPDAEPAYSASQARQLIDATKIRGLLSTRGSTDW